MTPPPHRHAPALLPLLLLLLACVCLTAGREAAAQGSRADYDRAGTLRARTAGKVRNERLDVHWADGGRRLWYRATAADGAVRFVLVDCQTGTRAPLFDEAALARAVRAAIGLPADARLPLVDAALANDRVFLLFAAGDTACAYDPRTGSAEVIPLGRATPFHLRCQKRVRNSRAGGAETHVLFANGLAEPLAIEWVTESGARRSYGEVEPGAVRRQHTFAGHAWVFKDAAGRDRGAFVAEQTAKVAWVGPDTPAVGAGPRGRPSRSSADLPRQAFVRDHNVRLRTGGEETALTRDGSPEDGYGGRVWQSPDGTRAVVLKTRAGGDRKVHYVEAAPRDQLQPKLHSYDYLKPGDAIPVAKPHLFDLVALGEIPIDDELFADPWSIRDIRFAPDGSRFTFLYNQRGHQVLRIVAVDATSGAARALVDEVGPTFIDYASKQYVSYLDGTNEIVWSSERSGWNHLYLYDAEAGRVKNAITSGPWVVRGVERIDAERRQVWFTAGGIRPDQDPYHVHYCRVDLDGGNLVVLTAGDGTHEVEFAPDGETFVDRYSRVDLPPVTELRRSADGSLVAELERADASALLETGWRPPERFVAKGRDGTTDIWGIIRRPTNHDPAREYPVIESIYAGPHGAFVPKSFHVHSQQQELAELGFIVVQIDGMGTNFRSRAFHDVCWKNLGDAGLPDRIRWIEAAARADPSFDLSRVGIYGGSAGGQSALRALLAHPELYHVAVADCGCHDNRMDKIWWNEQWMGWPVGPHYEEQSNVTQAHRLQGKLLLIVGALDENVDPASTMQVADALIRADRDFDLLAIPGAGHGAAETPYGARRRSDFFVRHLLGVEPRWGE